MTKAAAYWGVLALFVAGCAAALGATFALSGCAFMKSPGGKALVLSSEQIACALAQGLEPEDPGVQAACQIADELVPDLVRIFAAKRLGESRAWARRFPEAAARMRDAGQVTP